MSLDAVHESAEAARFPRVSGDEPLGGDLADRQGVFSPRERG